MKVVIEATFLMQCVTLILVLVAMLCCAMVDFVSPAGIGSLVRAAANLEEVNR